MTWVSWRQYRIELAIVLAILAGLAAYLVPIGLEKYDLYHDSGLEACINAGQECPDLRDRFSAGYDSVNMIVGWFNFIPAIVGLVLAAPLVSEFERRTYRLAWTQSITRERWFLTKLGVAIAGVVVFAGLMTLLMTWWHTPLDRAQTLAGNDLGGSYGFEGAMPIAYTLFAFALALTTGVLTRRTMAAMPVALVGFLVMRLVFETVFRAGLSSDASFEAVDGGFAPGEGTRDMARFWRVQAAEATIFFSATLALLSVTFWQVRRQMS